MSRGTYVRQLGEDIAQKLDTVGHLTSLRREKSGGFGIEQAIALEEVSWLTTGHREWKETKLKKYNFVIKSIKFFLTSFLRSELMKQIIQHQKS